MAQLQIAYLPRRGTQERWRRLCQEVAELRPEQFAAVCQQAGITQVQVRLLQLLHSELLLVTVQMQEPQQTREALASSQSPFAHWLREQLQGLLGWDVQEVLADPPADLLLTSEVEGNDEWTETEKTARHQSAPPGIAWRMTPVKKENSSMTDSVPKDPATTPGSQTADTTTQYNKKSGKGLRDGVVSELATFYEVLPGHEDELSAACQRMADTLRGLSEELHMKTGLRDERHVIFDGGKRLMWCTTFETDWDPYVEDAALVIGIENFIDWVQHTTEWPRFEAWLREAGGVEKVNAVDEKSVRMSTRGLKEFLLSVQTPAAGYFNAMSDVTHTEIRKAMQVQQAFQQVLDTPGAAEALQQPTLKPLADLAAD